MIFVQYIQTKFVCNWKKEISAKIMEYYLFAPYKKIMESSQGEKLYTLGTLCNVAIDGFVMRGLNLLTNIIIIGMIMSYIR